jgi:hypothetical protein
MRWPVLRSVSAGFSRTAPARPGSADEPVGSRRARLHTVGRLAAYRNDDGQRQRPSARNPAHSLVRSAPDTSSRLVPRSCHRAPAAECTQEVIPPTPGGAIPSSSSDRNAAPVAPMSSRNVVPFPPAASLVRARSPAGSGGANCPAAELPLLSSPTRWLPLCRDRVARAPRCACSRR